jgi:FkbM family methyltransferase
VAEFRECLIKNVTKTNLVIRNEALGNQNTTCDMIITEGNTGHTHVDPQSLGHGTTPIITLDSLELPVVNYIKLDCEGFEYRVLQGAEQTLQRCRPIVVVEQKPHDAYKKEYAQLAAVALLTNLGMSVMATVKDDWILGWR